MILVLAFPKPNTEFAQNQGLLRDFLQVRACIGQEQARRSRGSSGEKAAQTLSGCCWLRLKLLLLNLG